MKKYVLRVILIKLLLSVSLYSQETFNKTYGNFGDDFSTSIIEVEDGNYLFIGGTEESKNKDIASIIKIDNNGNKLWKKTFPRIKDNRFNSIIKTSDSGYIVLANDRIVKLDNMANKLWDKKFDIEYSSEFNSILQIENGNYILAGSIYKKNKHVSLIITLDSNGNKIWDKTFGGVEDNSINSIQSIKDGGYIITGSKISGSSVKSDTWVFKIDKNGNKIWDKTFGGVEDDFGEYIQETKAGDLIIAGSTSSKGNGNLDMWIIKLDKNGNKVWDKTFGETEDDFVNTIKLTKDNGYIVAGTISRKNLEQGKDAWIIKLDKDGNTSFDIELPNDLNLKNEILCKADGGMIKIIYSNKYYQFDIFEGTNPKPITMIKPSEFYNNSDIEPYINKKENHIEFGFIKYNKKYPYAIIENKILKLADKNLINPNIKLTCHSK